jgi:phage anti-repressor protein
MALPLEVTTYLEDYQTEIEKQLFFVEGKDWSVIENLKKRGSSYKMQHLITNRIISKLKHFADITSDCRSNKVVQEFLQTLVKFVDIYVTRFDNCTKLYDWTKYEETFDHLSEEEIGKLVEEETSFQSEVLDNVNKFRLEVKKLNLDNTADTIDIGIYGDKPVPLIMRRKMESMFPEIKEYLKNKNGEK